MVNLPCSSLGLELLASVTDELLDIAVLKVHNKHPAKAMVKSDQHAVQVKVIAK